MNADNLKSFEDDAESQTKKIMDGGYTNFAGAAKNKLATSLVPLVRMPRRLCNCRIPQPNQQPPPLCLSASSLCPAHGAY